MPNLDLLLINPSTNEEVYGKLSKNTAHEPPFLAALTAGYVRDHDYSVELLDANVQGLSQIETAEIVLDMKPKILGIIAHGHQPSASSQLMGAIGKLCKEIRGRTNTPIFLSGVHPSSLPERTLREESCDFVARGEVYDTLVGLIGAQSHGNFSNVPGLCYIDDQGNFVMNKASPLIDDLDGKLSNVAWDLLPPFSQYRSHNWHSFENIEGRSPYGAICTSLGCPFTCSFCVINAEFKAAEADNSGRSLDSKKSDLERLSVLDSTKTRIRYWSPETSIKHIDHMVENGVRNIKFIDEMFVLDRRQVLGIADKIIERGYGDKINIWAYARIDTVRDKALLDRIKQAGINWLCLGIESANPNVRDGADKKFRNEHIFKYVRQVENVGINVLGNYMVGLRSDTMESMQQTLDMALELNTPWFNVYATMAYPGAPDYTWAKRKGMPLPGDPGVPGGWTAYSHHSWYTLPMKTESLSAADVLRFRDHFFDMYISNTSYLELVRNRFGQEVVDHLKDISKHKINRRILGDPQPN